MSLRSKQLSNNFDWQRFAYVTIGFEIMTVHYTPAWRMQKALKRKLLHRKVTAFKLVDYSKEGTSTFQRIHIRINNQ